MLAFMIQTQNKGKEKPRKGEWLWIMWIEYFIDNLMLLYRQRLVTKTPKNQELKLSYHNNIIRIEKG